MNVGNNNKGNAFMFKPVQFFGRPSVFPPPIDGKIQAAVQFIVPRLLVDNTDKQIFSELALKCETDIWKMDTQQATNERTKETATLITFAFYIDSADVGNDKNNFIAAKGRLLIERFLGLVSFFFGTKLSAIHIQYSTGGKDRTVSTILPMSIRTSQPTIKLKLPENLDFVLSEEIFSALFWLRRGLAERDPIENFSSLMVCLQIMANKIVPEQIISRTCPFCGSEIEKQQLSITQKMKVLLVDELGASSDLFEKLWKAMNAIVAHGNKPVEFKVFLELTELKFDAVKLAYKGIKLALGIPLNSPPNPDQAFFVTDAFMYVD
jgi:hypothetical protein